MAVTRFRMHGPAQVSGTASTKYTAGADTTMRYIHISNPSLTQTVKFYMSIGADAPGTRIFDGLVLPPTSVFPHHCLHVIATSESVQAWADIANVLVLTMTGEQVSG